MVVIDQLSGIFPKIASSLHQPLNPPQKKHVTKYAPIPHQVRPTEAKNFPLDRPNTIEEDYGNSYTDVQRTVHISHSGPYIILLDVPVSPPRVRCAQPPRMETGGQS